MSLRIDGCLLAHRDEWNLSDSLTNVPLDFSI